MKKKLSPAPAYRYTPKTPEADFCAIDVMQVFRKENPSLRVGSDRDKAIQRHLHIIIERHMQEIAYNSEKFEKWVKAVKEKSLARKRALARKKKTRMPPLISNGDTEPMFRLLWQS